MKKCIIIITVSLLLICTGCSTFSRYLQNTEEEEIYNQTVNDFFTALDNGDSDAIYNMFSSDVQEKDSDLKEQIKRLIEVYSGPTDIIGNDGILAGEYLSEGSQRTSLVYNEFPVVSQEKYYWCYFELMYENVADESQVGITEVLFYTADEYCILEYDKNAKRPDTVGLSVFADKTLNCEIRSIEGHPYKYTSDNETLNLSDVVAFFESSHKYTDFVKAFGEPNATNIFYYYELPEENGSPRYLQLSVDADTDTIYSASIVDDLKYLETVWEIDE